MKGFNCLIYVDDRPVGAQINADLRRSTTLSDITNRIELDWEESLPRVKNWSINCSGAYVVDNESFVALEEAFLNSTSIEVKLQSPEATFSGFGYITNFPLGANFNDTVSYNIMIQGSGPLKRL